MMHKMKIGSDKTKLMTNSADSIQREIKVKMQKMGALTSFKYLAAICQTMANSETEQATAAPTKLKLITYLFDQR